MKKAIIIFTVLLVVVIGLAIKNSGRDSTYDEFAKCLSDSDTKFYGAYWCPHCNTQKNMFSDSKDLIPYIECAEINNKEQLAVCKDAGIMAYPTWTFSNGERVEGVLTLEQLSLRTSCKLP